MLTKKANNLSARQRKSMWRAENNQLFDIHTPKYDPMKDFEEVEKQFYIGQKSSERIGYISDTIDFKYKNQEAEAKRQKFEEEEAERNELLYIEEGETLAYRAIENDPDYEMLEDSVNTEIETSYDYDSNAILRTKSGRVLIKAAAAEVQD